MLNKMQQKWFGLKFSRQIVYVHWLFQMTSKDVWFLISHRYIFAFFFAFSLRLKTILTFTSKRTYGIGTIEPLRLITFRGNRTFVFGKSQIAPNHIFIILHLSMNSNLQCIIAVKKLQPKTILYLCIRMGYRVCFWIQYRKNIDMNLQNLYTLHVSHIDPFSSIHLYPCKYFLYLR